MLKLQKHKLEERRQVFQDLLMQRKNQVAAIHQAIPNNNATALETKTGSSASIQIKKSSLIIFPNFRFFIFKIFLIFSIR